MSDKRRIIDSVAATLLKAADYIEEHGWCQRTLRAADGSVCMLGALHFVGATHEADHQLLRYLNVRSLPEWQDAPGRTKAEVLTVLRSAAKSRTSA